MCIRFTMTSKDLTIVADSADRLVRSVIKLIILTGNTWKTHPASHGRATPVREVRNLTAVLVEPRHRCSASKAFPDLFNPGLAAARFLYMLSGSNRLNDIEFYTDGVGAFTDDGITLAGSAYGQRIFNSRPGLDQVERCVDLINSRPNTKRAAMAVYLPEDCGRSSADVPCCLAVVLQPRGRKLSGTGVMRANDALKLLA